MLTAVAVLGESHHFASEGGESGGVTNQPPTGTTTPTETATGTETGTGQPAGDPAAGQDHLLRYHAVLLSASQIASFVESPLFLLHADHHRTGASGGELVGGVDRAPFQARWGQP